MWKDWIEARDGVSLHAREWPQHPATGTILIVHGLGEHIGRHAHVAEFLNGRGWRVAGYDHRGHGASGGKRGRLARADDLLVDLALVIDSLPSESAGPLVLLGHSMGGGVAARFVAGALDEAAPWSRPVDGLVLSSPALDAGMSANQQTLLALLGPTLPNLALGNGVDPDLICRDPATVAAYRVDPLVHDRITPRLARAIVDAGARAIELAPRWVVPTLLLYGGADRCVDPQGSVTFATRAPKNVVEAHGFPMLFHEVFNEPEKAEVLSVLGAWLDRLRPSPTRSPP